MIRRGDCHAREVGPVREDGHTYATYGPAVEFTVEDRMPGETVNTTAGSSVEASATVRNLDELAYAEVIRNGTTVSNVTLDGTNDTMSTDVDIDGNAWVAFRVVDEDGDRALTSPVWIRPVSSRIRDSRQRRVRPEPRRCRARHRGRVAATALEDTAPESRRPSRPDPGHRRRHAACTHRCSAARNAAEDLSHAGHQPATESAWVPWNPRAGCGDQRRL